VQIKVHRGTHQIGGSITEIKTAKARLIIDIGLELPRADKTESKSFDIAGVTTGAADCNAVLVTHYHGDHVGMFASVLPEIPIYIGGAAKKILGVVQKTLKTKLGEGKPELIDAFKEYEAGKTLFFGDIKVTPYTIDHSAFDAYMLLIEAEGKRILHTGDFRMHGARGRKMPLVFETFAKNIDVLIIEGTMLSRPNEKVLTEHELGSEATKLSVENKNVFVICSSTNIDTIAEFYNAAIANKKPFIVCDDMQAEILQIVAATAKSPFYNFTRQNVYTYGEQLHKYMTDCGFCFIGRTNSKTMKAIERFSDSLLIYSMWGGYLDKKHPAFNEYKRVFIDKATANGSKLLHLHTSGHATAEQLKQVCEITQAKTIVPIHGEYPEAFTKMGIKAEIKILQDGEKVDF
jgi:ribonuclease J